MRQRADRLLGEPYLLDDTGPPHRGRAVGPVLTAAGWLLPVLALLVVVVAYPVGRTVVASLLDAGGVLAPFDNYWAAFAEWDAWPVLLRTAAWTIGLPLVVTCLGYGFARLPGLWAADPRTGIGGGLFTVALVAPMALPLVVTGIAFRLLYDPDPQRQTASWIIEASSELFGVHTPALLGPRLVTVSLMTAFVWAWVGLAVVLFRASLDRLPHELADVVRTEGGGTWRIVRDVHWPHLRRITAIVFVLVAVASSRTFDLVLIMAPGSVRGEAEVFATLVWSRPEGQPDGVAAAIRILWLVVLVLSVLIAAALFGPRSWPTSPVGVGGPSDPPDPRHRRSLGRRAKVKRAAGHLVAAAVAALWLYPLLLLLVTSLHSQRDAAHRGWLAWPSVESYRNLIESVALGRVLVGSVGLSLLVTTAAVFLAAMAAYSLTFLNVRLPRIATIVLLAAAAVPVQVTAGGVHGLLDSVGVTNSLPALVLVHASLTVPVAVVVLRNAFGSVSANWIAGVRLASNHETGVVARLAATRARSAMLAVAALVFVQTWNDLVVGLLLGGVGLPAAGVQIYGLSRQFDSSAGLLAAAAVLFSVVPVLVIAASREHIVRGLILGEARR